MSVFQDSLSEFAMADTVNCSYIPPEIAVDSDIVGYGALIAFFTSALVAVLAIVFAYLSDALDVTLLTDLDRKVIARFQWKWCHLKRKYTDLSNIPEEKAEAMLEIRSETVTQFILTLSDQQLVTGLAALISGMSDPRNLSGYEFTVIFALDWFSSTTHLATL
jgi:hypothetical protein